MIQEQVEIKNEDQSAVDISKAENKTTTVVTKNSGEENAKNETHPKTYENVGGNRKHCSHRKQCDLPSFTDVLS